MADTLPATPSSSHSLSGTFTGAPLLFRDQSFDGKATVTNTGSTLCNGAIYLRFTSRDGFLKVIDSCFSIKPGETKTYEITVPGFNFHAREGKLELIYRELPDNDTVLVKHAMNIYPHPAPRPGENVLVNGSFELGKIYGGATLGYYDSIMINNGWEGPGCWYWTTLDGWFRERGTPEQITSPKGGQTGEQCLRLDAAKTPVSVVSTLGRYIAPGTYTIRARRCFGAVHGTCPT